MDLKFKERFVELWRKYFDGAELPTTFYYTNEEGRGELVKAPTDAHQCVIGVLGEVRKGRSLCFEADSMGCGGGKRYLRLYPGDETELRIFSLLRDPR